MPDQPHAEIEHLAMGRLAARGMARQELELGHPAK